MPRLSVEAARKANFKNFLLSTWRSLGFDRPTDLQYDMADYLQQGGVWDAEAEKVVFGKRARKILMGFRGAAKSYITVPYGVWRLDNDRDIKVLATSATGGFAADNARFAYRMVTEFDWLAHLKPSHEQRDSALAFDVRGAKVSKDASFTAVGIFGQLTGRRADVILPDDVETPNTSDTEVQRAELRKRIGEFGAIIKPGGDIIYLGTAQEEETVYLDLEQKGYQVRMYPILYPFPDQTIRYGGRLAPKIVRELEANPDLAGTSTEPTRFDEEDIEQRRLDWGNTEFDRQFRLFIDAGLADSRPLKLRDLVVMDLHPGGKVPADIAAASGMEPWRYDDIQCDGLTGDSHVYGPRHVDGYGEMEGVAMFIDTSGEGGDETTWTIVGSRLGYLFFLWQGYSLDGTQDHVLEEIAADAKKWKVNIIKPEDNFGGGMFEGLLRPQLQKIGYGCTIEPVRSSGQKEKRIINTLEPLLTAKRLIVNTEVLRRDFTIAYPNVEDAKRRYYRLTYQLTRITKKRNCIAHDDRIDGLAGACAHWVEVIGRVIEDAAKADREAKLQEEADKIIEYRKKHGLPTGLPVNQGWRPKGRRTTRK